MSTEPDQQNETVLETIIPQDKTGGVNRVFFGLSLGEVLLVAGPAFLFFWITTSILDVPLNRWVAFGTLGIGVVLYLTVKITPWYSTPLEVLSRTISYARSRLRMPLVAKEAEDVPGIADVHSEYQAVELPDGALIGVVEVYPVNTSQLSYDQWIVEVSKLANSINSTIARDAGTGFDVEINVSQTIPNAGDQVEGLEAAADNGYPVENGGTPPYARQYAEEQADETIDQLARSGVMDRGVHIVTAVDVDEANDSGNLIDQFSNLSIVRASDQQYDAQAALLDNRIETIKSSVSAFTNAERLDADELVQLYREYWLDSEEPLDYTATTQGPVTNPQVYVDGEPHEDLSRDQERQPDVQDDTATGDTATEGSEADASTEDDQNADETATKDEGEDHNDSAEADEESSGRIGNAREWVSSTITSLRGHASQATRDQLVYSPAFVDENNKYVELNDQFTSTIWITGWPKHPEPGLLESILSVPEIRYDISISLDSTDYHAKLDELADERQYITSSALLKEESGDADVEDASSLAAEKQVIREHMQDHDLECWEVSMAITLRGESEAAVTDARRTVVSRCSAMNISTTTANGRQLAGLRTTSPILRNDLEAETRIDTRFDMTSDGVACLYPFSGYYPVEPEGTIYGMAKTGQRNTGDPIGMLQIDRFRRTAPHRFWVGRSGSGKSFDIKNHIAEEMLRNPTENTVIVDIARGFDGIVEAFNGSKILVGETTINPFEIRPPEDARGTEESLDDKVRLITDMFQIYMMHNAPEEQAQAIRSTIAKTVRQAYKDAGPEDDEIGITNDPETHSKQSPTMEDYFETLARMAENPREYTYKQTQTEVDALEKDIGVLLNRLKEFQPGGTYDYLCGESEVDMYDRVVYFDMNKFENDTSAAKGMIMALIASHSYELAKQTRGHVNLVVDEAHDLFRDAAQADQIESMVRAGRNTGLMFDFISQAGEDFDAGAAKVIAKQCSIAVWRDLGEIDEQTPLDFGLTEEQASLVSGGLATGDNDAMEYSEALVDVEGDRYLIERRVSDYAARVVDYRESDHGDFDAYMEGKSLEDQRAEAEADREQQVGGPTAAGDDQPGRAVANGGERVIEERVDEDPRDKEIGQPNVLGAGIEREDERDAQDAEPDDTSQHATDEERDTADGDSSRESDENRAESDSSSDQGKETEESPDADVDDETDADGTATKDAGGDSESSGEDGQNEQDERGEDEQDEQDDQEEEAPVPDGGGESESTDGSADSDNKGDS